MTAQTRSVTKGRFEDGDKPDGSVYTDLIDSYISVADSTAQTITSDFTAPVITGSTEVSSPQGNFVEVSASTGSFTNVRTATVSVSSMHVNNINNHKVEIGTAGERGYPVLTQVTTINNAATAASTAAVLASGSNVLDAYFFVSTAFGTAASDVELRLGDADNETKYGTITMDTNIATGMHHLSNGAFTSAGTSWLDVSASAKTILAKVTAVSGALASGASGQLHIVYVSK